MTERAGQGSFSIRGVEVQFPFKPYDCQLSYMEAVITALQTKKNALLESPTGTGKTLCLLCATLSWRESLRGELVARATKAEEEQRKVEAMPAEEVSTARRLRADLQQLAAEKASTENLPTIIYASRTHSQLKQVIGELKRTRFAKGLKTTVLSSRQQMCRHRVVQQIQGSVLNLGCKSLVSKRACKWYNNTEKYVNGREEDVNNSVLDIEDLIKIGDHKTVCPYYLSRSLTSKADLIFLPYNYLIDAKTRTGLGINWENSVVIFDEAHNIESVCSGSASFDLPVSIVAGSVEELGTAVEIMQSSGKVSSDDVRTVENMRGMQLVLRKLEDVISSYDGSVTKPGEFIVELLNDLRLTEQSWGTFSGVIDVAIDILTEDALDAHNPARMSTTRLSILRECLGQVFSAPIAERDFSGYRVHIHKEKKEGKHGLLLPTLSFWCFDAGEGMAALRDGNMKIRSILLTSGTLSPMASFVNELRTEFPIRLENPHVIDKKQVWVGVVPKGPAGAVLNSSYKTRSDDGYLTDLGNSIFNFSKIVPDGMLVFFPSYSVMSQCIAAWKAKGIWERIGQYKGLVVEPTNAAAFANSANEFKSKLDSPEYNGAAFFGVCRGKASEGLDFSDRAGRAVIICGIPFANAVDPKIKLKKEVMNSKLADSRSRNTTGATANGNGADAERISGDAWYVQQALRAVNQAIGRVIRHKDDFGAVLLCEERFGQSRHVGQLSKWLRDDVVTYDSYGDAMRSLSDFFRSQRAIPVGAPVVSKPAKKSKGTFALVGDGAGRGNTTSSGSAGPALPANDAQIVMPNMMASCKSRLGSAASSSIDSILAGSKTRAPTQETTSMSVSSGDVARATHGLNKPWLMEQRKATQRQTKPRSLGLAVAKAARPAPRTVGPPRPTKRHIAIEAPLKKPTPSNVPGPVPRNHEQAPTSATGLVSDLKRELGEQGFQRISAALRTYSSNKQIDPLIEEASRLLFSHEKLSIQFRERIPAEHRGAFDARIQRERRLQMSPS